MGWVAAVVCLAGLGLWGGEGGPGAGEPFSPVSLAEPEQYRRELALALVGQLREPAFRNLLGSRLGPGVTRVSLNRLVVDYAASWPAEAHLAFRDRVLGLDLEVRRAHGLQGFSQGLLALEVLWPRPGPPSLDWDTVRMGVAPQGPRRAVTRVETYDLAGVRQDLDPATPPGVLVLMPVADRGEIKRAGIAFLNAGLGQAELAAEPPPAGPNPIPCAKLTYIRLADTQEPWWKGAAEVYAFAVGIDPTVDRPRLRLLDLPYLAYARTDYRPNQLVLFWNEYRFSAADLQLWEQDSGINYQDVLDAVLKAVTAAMTLGGAPAFAWIPGLADAILKAMPAAWFRDNDDYLDTFYTLERDRTYVHLAGAAGNAVIDLEPYLLQP